MSTKPVEKVLFRFYMVMFVFAFGVGGFFVYSLYENDQRVIEEQKKYIENNIYPQIAQSLWVKDRRTALNIVRGMNSLALVSSVEVIPKDELTDKIFLKSKANFHIVSKLEVYKLDLDYTWEGIDYNVGQLIVSLDYQAMKSLRFKRVCIAIAILLLFLIVTYQMMKYVNNRGFKEAISVFHRSLKESEKHEWEQSLAQNFGEDVSPDLGELFLEVEGMRYGFKKQINNLNGEVLKLDAENKSNTVLLDRYSNNLDDLSEFNDKYKQLNNSLAGMYKDKVRNLQKILSSIQQGILTIDSDLVIQEGYSEFLHQWFGEKVSGENFIDLALRFMDLSKEDRSHIHLSLSRCFGKNKEFFEENSIELPREMYLKSLGLYCIVKWDSIVDENGLVYQILVSFLNQTELVNAKNLAEKANNAKTRFLGNLSHELRTPMNSIMGALDMLEDHPSESKEYMELISSGAELSLMQINKLLLFVDLEGGELILKKSPCVLQSVFDKIKAESDLLASQNGVDLIWNVSSDLPRLVNVDERRFVELVIPVLDNAIKFGVNHPVSVDFNIKEKHEESFVLSIQIEDNGPGFPAGDSEPLEESFVLENKSYSRAYGGLGVGLSIVEELVKGFDGLIHFENNEIQGATVLIEIPLDILEVENDVVEKPFKGDSRILIVDDILANRKLLCKILTNMGHRVVDVSSGYDAVEFVRTAENLDLILMDLQMPNMDGFEAAEKIFEIKPDSVMYALSANSSQMDRQKCEELGMKGFLAKPIRKSDLTVLFDA